MITNKQIEEAKKAFIADKKVLGVEAMNDLACGFTAGAHWAIEQFLKDLWHDANEVPKCEDKGILIKHKVLDRIETGDYHIEYDSFILGEDFRNEEDWKEFKDIGYDCVDSWLCIDDLIPKQKGGEDNERI